MKERSVLSVLEVMTVVPSGDLYNSHVSLMRVRSRLACDIPLRTFEVIEVSA